ncbi:protein ALP1-like [Rhagoletis pomonella]|uniref:protein ALP1-like n=1 Tax=Rhagoletis pomonella TaxID=28610 RepID=UPI00177EF3BC|nr:protein ALP1-like [Rhagoletis pomonella]XP_036346910.1 protein ALP1-like [Rhagoletis pomonella]
MHCSSIHYADDEEIIEILADVAAESSSSGDDSEEEQVEHPKFVGFLPFYKFLLKQCYISKARCNENDQNHSRTMSGKPKIPAKTMIYMYIWYLSNTITYRQLANLFGVTKSTTWAIVRRVVAWIISIGYEFIKWPTGEAVEDTTRKFLQRKKVPGVIGAIDCTHITINAPKKDKHIYFDRKRNYSLVLQGIVDADMKFIDIYCGEPGSYHDFRVLKRSAFYRKAENSVENLFPNSTFILGDSAYPCKNYLIPVFKDYGSLTEQQIRFNKIHSSARIVVENAFGLLKGRFRRLLKFTEHKDLCDVTHLVASACIMHNICILKNDDTFIVEANESVELEPVSVSESDISGDRRNELFIQLLRGNV